MPVSRSRKRHQLDDLDAGEPAFEQVAQRKIAAPVVHGDDDFVDFELARQAQQRTVGRHQALRRHLDHLVDAAYEAHDAETALVDAAAQRGDVLRRMPQPYTSTLRRKMSSLMSLLISATTGAEMSAATSVMIRISGPAISPMLVMREIT